MKLHEQQDVRSVSITTGDGPALVNLGTIHGDVQQVINVVHEAGHAELADLLRQLAAAISETEALGEARADYLEQVRFIAEQATLPPEERQTGVVKGLVLGLRTGLQDAAHLAGILNLAGPAIASVFGVPWPF